MLFTTSPHHEMSRSPIPKSGLDRGNPIATGGDDRLDELTVGVLVAAIDEFREAEMTIRPFVVDALEIERANGIVRGADEKHAVESARRALERVTQSRGFKRRELFG